LINTYAYGGEEEVNHREPKEILKEIELFNENLDISIDKLKENL